ncbi:MAG TPA: endolytic transglycosylase MltG [Gemmatimonadales bacterium]|nr:endolytic transglycosylase MltG [Gemmatimonadales bacterium]
MAIALLGCACGAPPGAPREIVAIPPGATLHAVADSLAAHRVITSPFWFRLAARVSRTDRRLQSGTYALARGAGGIAALRALTSGHALLTRFTVPEGFALLDIAAAAQRELGIPSDSFLAAARDTALLREFGVPASSFEGFLQPETYLFAQGTSAEAVIREMAVTFRAAWDPAWDAAAAAQGLDRMAVVTLASIVEGEAQADSDRALIAAVFRNRLRLGMPLQADATVQYAIQRATGERKLRLYEKDYALASPYNTYLHPGLPPGPVGSPGHRSLQAVSNPAPGPYLYYGVGPGGRHIFSRTYAEHLRAVARSRRMR